MIEVSSETEARINDEAPRQGVSLDALLERLMSEHAPAADVASSGAAPELPRLHLAAMGAHRRDIYHDVD
jgi:hypothetical protein